MFDFLFRPKLWGLAGIFSLAFLMPAFAEDPDVAPDFEQGAVFLEADEMFKDPEQNRYVARGDVEARYENRILRANEVIYFPDAGKVHAKGSVIVVESDGAVSFADEVELDEDLTTGVALGFFARLENNAKVGATHAIHSDNGRVNSLRKAFYTACESCARKDGTSSKPTWRLRAREAIQNQDDKMFYYRDAVLEVKGVPLLYSPYFAHADPTAGRRSGLLFPNVGQSQKYGFYIQQPYYRVLSDYSDLTITPRIFTGKRPLIFGEYRRNFYSGSVKIDGGITKEQEFDGVGQRFGQDKFRGYIFGQGKFDINSNTYWGFGAEAVSDDLFFLRYDIPYGETRGLFRNSSNRLSNQLYAVRQTSDFYGSIAAIRYQGLRGGDVDRELPIAAPLVDVKKVISNTPVGGKFTVGLNTAVLTRLDGIDSRRASVSLDWDRRFVTRNGIVAKPFATGRADVYSIQNQEYVADLGTDTQSFGRALGVVGAEVRWPWIKPGKSVNWVVEPIVHFSASPNGNGVGTFDVITTDNLGNIVRTPTSLLPNEDSLAVDFDETNLFRSSRFSGYDLWEDGIRASVGGRIGARWGEQGYASLTAGQIFRSRANAGFAANSGLSGTKSDYVAGLSFSTGRTFTLASHARFDQSNMSVQRFDAKLTSYLSKEDLGPLRSVLHSVNTSVLYTNVPAGAAGSRAFDEITVSGQTLFSKNWGFNYSNIYNFESNESRRSSIGFVYQDDCSRFELVYQRSNILDRSLATGDSIRFRFTLTTLGSFGD